MPILRRSAVSNYTIISNNILEDGNLGGFELGVLCFLLGKPDGWVVDADRLRKRFAVGKEKIRASLKLLADAGYISF